MRQSLGRSYDLEIKAALMPRVSGRKPILGILILLAAAGGCHSEQPHAELTPGSTRAPKNTVGDAALSHNLSIEELARLNEVSRELAMLAEQDRTFHVRLDFPMDSSVMSQARRVDSTPAFRMAVQTAGLTAEQFVTGWAAYGTARTAIRIADSTGETLRNVSSQNVEFLKANAAVIDSLGYLP